MSTKGSWWLLVVLTVMLLATHASAQNTLWEKYNDAGKNAFQQGRYAETEKQFKAALKEAEQFGSEDPRLAATLNNLADVYRAQGKYALAEPLYQRALAIFEKAPGPEDSIVAVSLNRLAGLYHAQGKYTQAEPLYQRALAINEKLLGPEDPNVALNLDNLGAFYNAQGKYAQA